MGPHKSKMARMKQHAIRCKNMSALKDLLNQENINPNSQIKIDDYEATPLWFAVSWEDLHLTELFLSAGACANTPSGCLRSTPLHIAAYKHNVQLVKLLLDYGANPNVLDKWNYTPLMYVTVHHEPTDVVELSNLLLSYGCDVNFGATLNNTGTVERANSFDLPMLTSNYDDKYMIMYNREPMGATSGTVLHLAVQNQHLPNYCIELLLDAGATVSKLNLNGQTPLMGVMLDVYYDYHSCVRDHAELLVSKMTAEELNAQDKRGWTCFHYAAQQGSVSRMELLMKAGCDCNITSSNGETPLWILLIYGWREAANYLLTNGCDVDMGLSSSAILQMNQDVDVCRYGPILPIEFAICNKYYSLAKLMLHLGCKFDNNADTFDFLFSSGSEKYKEFLSYASDFLAQRSEIQPLYSLCRTVVRQTFKQSLDIKCQVLGLPTALQDFVCFRDTVL